MNQTATQRLVTCNIADTQRECVVCCHATPHVPMTIGPTTCEAWMLCVPAGRKTRCMKKTSAPAQNRKD